MSATPGSGDMAYIHELTEIDLQMERAEAESLTPSIQGSQSPGFVAK